jgi:DNA invertase Pin-like site-specific DNA recombinase
MVVDLRMLSHYNSYSIETGGRMKIGCARTSTIEQKAGLEAQIAELKALGCEELFEEQVSSVQRREGLEKALRFIRKDDVLVITKLDRLARSVSDLVRIMETLEAKESSLRILAMNLDTNTPTGRLLLHLVGSVAQFERSIMLERQREGISKAKSDGKYKGRVPTARAKSSEVVAMFKADKKPTEIAKSLAIGRASVYRILNVAGLVSTNSERQSSRF